MTFSATESGGFHRFVKSKTTLYYTKKTDKLSVFPFILKVMSNSVFHSYDMGISKKRKG